MVVPSGPYAGRRMPHSTSLAAASSNACVSGSKYTAKSSGESTAPSGTPLVTVTGELR